MLEQKVLLMIGIALFTIMIVLKLAKMAEGFKSGPNVFASNDKKETYQNDKKEIYQNDKKDQKERKVTFADNEIKADVQDQMWSNGGVFAGMTIKPETRFQTKIACSCSGYGVARDTADNMPYNDDSNIYNSKLMKKQFEDK